jgi:hypothetical protein
MSLDEDWAKLREKYRRKRKPIVAYKVLTHLKRSPYATHQWRWGANRSNRTTVRVEDREAATLSINKGFHFFLGIRAARVESQYTPDWFPPDKVFKCEIQPSEVVAVGRFSGEKCIVARRAKLIEEVK